MAELRGALEEVRAAAAKLADVRSAQEVKSHALSLVRSRLAANAHHKLGAEVEALKDKIAAHAARVAELQASVKLSKT